MKLFQVAGYLGSGKTTLIIALGKALTEKSYKVAILVNDVSGIPVDGKVIEEYGLTVKELGGGCICCQVVGSMTKTLETLAKNMHPDMVIIEPTGMAVPNSIKDALGPLSKKLPIEFGPTVVLFDVTRAEKLLTYDTLKRLVGKQLADADIIALSKVDRATEDEIEAAAEGVRAINPEAEIMRLSVVTGEGLNHIVQSVGEVEAAR